MVNMCYDPACLDAVAGNAPCWPVFSSRSAGRRMVVFQKISRRIPQENAKYQAMAQQ